MGLKIAALNPTQSSINYKSNYYSFFFKLELPNVSHRSESRKVFEMGAKSAMTRNPVGKVMMFIN